MSLSSIAGLVAFLAVLYVWLRKSNANVPLPPGPKPLPVLGNIRDLKAKEPWISATQWAKTYGEYMFFVLKNMTCLTYSEIIQEKSSIYTSWEWALSFLVAKPLPIYWTKKHLSFPIDLNLLWLENCTFPSVQMRCRSHVLCRCGCNKMVKMIFHAVRANSHLFFIGRIHVLRRPNEAPEKAHAKGVGSSTHS